MITLKENRMKLQALLIQEDVTLRSIISHLLLRKGYECHAATSLGSLDITDNQKYQVVISDVLFHGIRPEEYVLKLQQRLTYEKLFIITMLGQAKVKRGIYKLIDVDGYYDYPIDLSELEQKI